MSRTFYWWCIKTPAGEIMHRTTERSEELAIQTFLTDPPLTGKWECWKKDGYSAIQIETNEKGKHPDTIRATELQTQLDIWHRIFHTTQLSHAQARFDVAENGKHSDSIKLERLVKAMEVALLELQL